MPFDGDILISENFPVKLKKDILVFQNEKVLRKLGRHRQWYEKTVDWNPGIYTKLHAGPC